MVSRHVALFIPELRGGGAQRVIVNLAAAFAGRGYQVDLVLARTEGPLLSEIPAAVRVINCDCRSLVRLLLSVTRYLRSEQPAALMTTLRDANVIGPLARLCAGVGTRVVVREANTMAEARRSRGFRDTVLAPLMQVSYRLADRIVANSEATAADLVRFGLAGEAKVQVIHNPLDIAGIQQAAAAALDHTWFMPGSPPVILAIGRLVHQKDFSTFIRAIDLVRQRRTVRAVILGDGPLRPELDQLVASLGLSDVVMLPGFVTNPHRYTARAAVLTLSSRWEGFGNVLVEALAVGTPIVATNCPGGPAEILCDGKFGLLVPVGDVRMMADAMLDALDKPPNGEALRARAASFSMDAVAPRYLECLGFVEVQ